MRNSVKVVAILSAALLATGLVTACSRTTDTPAPAPSTTLEISGQPSINEAWATYLKQNNALHFDSPIDENTTNVQDLRPNTNAWVDIDFMGLDGAGQPIRPTIKTSGNMTASVNDALVTTHDETGKPQQSWNIEITFGEGVVYYMTAYTQMDFAETPDTYSTWSAYGQYNTDGQPLTQFESVTANIRERGHIVITATDPTQAPNTDGSGLPFTWGELAQSMNHVPAMP